MNKNTNLKWGFGLPIFLSALSLTAYNTDVGLIYNKVDILKTELNSLNIKPTPFIFPTHHFRSQKNGFWNDVATWESSGDKITWEHATFVPTFAAASIDIRSHIVTLSANATAKSLTIEVGGILTNSGPVGGYYLTITDDGNPTQPDFNIYGTYILFGNEPTFNPGATARVYGNGLVRVDDNIGGKSDNFALSTKVTFNTKAVFEWNIDKSFKTSGAIYFPGAGEEIPVFRVSKDPGSVGGGTLLTIYGILDVNTDFTFIGGSNKVFRNGIIGNSTLTQNNTANNRFTINGSNAILGGSSLKIVLSFPMNLDNSVTVPKDSSVTISGANINNNTLSVKGILDVTNIQVSPNTTLDVTATGTFKTSRVAGFSGTNSTIPGGSITLQLGSTIEFYRNGDQNFDSRLDFSNIIFSGSGSKKASSGFSPHGTITIKNTAILDSQSPSGYPFNIGNDYTNLVMMDNSRFILYTIDRNPKINGTYNLIGGIIQFDNNSGTKQTIRGTTLLPVEGNSVTYNQIEVTGSNVGIGNGNINLREGGIFTVKSNGVFEVNAQSIKALAGSANQKVIVESGALFITGSQHGFHGIESIVIPLGVSSIHPNIPITNILLEPNSTVNYHRSSLVHTSGIQTITTSIPYHHLIISGNQEKTAQLDGTIEIQGNLIKTSDAVFKHNNSTVVFNGSTAQNYYSAYPQIVFNNLINNNTIGLNIQDSLSVFRALTLGANSLLNINADITLQSNLENTANVAPIPVDAIINYSTHNRFIVERYIPNHRKAWQLIATPVIGDQTIQQSWQEGMVQGMNAINNTAGAPGNKKSGYGTTITSDRPTWKADGFDTITRPGPSLKTYNSLTNKWEGVSSTNIPIQNKEGYLLMVRGDRNVIVHDQLATATTLRTRGKIYTPATLPSIITITNTPGTFFSVGNPYASAIDFYSATRSNLGDSYIIWDPQLTNSVYSQYGLGAYRTISNGVAVPASENYTDGNYPPIQSGQAFFVQLALNATETGSISFTEDVKTTGSSPTFRGGNIFIKPEAHLRANLSVPAKDGSILLDGNLVQLHSQYSPSLDNLDAIKMMNTGENMGILRNNKILAIERKPLFMEADTIFYTLSGLKKQIYELEFISQKTDASGLNAYLEDIYLNQRTLLDPSGTTRIGFEVNNDVGSYNRNRFRVIFKAAKGPLSVTNSQFTAKAQNKEVLLRWVSENESGIEKYIIDKSISGGELNLLTEILAKKGSTNNYQIMDKEPVQGNNYYRLKIIYSNGKTEHSDIVKVTMNNGPIQFSLYPNPVSNGRVNIHFSNQAAGMYSMKLLNGSGETISSRNIYYENQTTIEVFNIENKPTGIYYLEIMKPDGERTLLKVKK